MGRYSPAVLPRNRGQELADKLLQAGETFAQGMRQKKLDQENKAYRQGSLDLQRQRLTDEEHYHQASLDRQRAGDAANGVIYDPDRRQGSAVALDLPAMPGDFLRLGTRIRAGQRSGTRDLGGGYTLDESLTPEARRRAAEETEQNRLAAALEAGGVDKGVSRIIAQAPNAAQYFLKKPLSPDDEATIRLRNAQADRERAQAYYYRTRAGMGGSSGSGHAGADEDQGDILSPDGNFLTVPGLSPLDAGRITTEYDRGTTMNRQLADALAPPDQRTDLMQYGTPGDSARVAQSDSLRKVVTDRMRNRPTIPDLIRSRTYMTGVQSGASTTAPRQPSPPMQTPAPTAPTPGVRSRRGGSMTPNERARAQRWNELKQTYPDMPDADITARVLKEIPDQ